MLKPFLISLVAFMAIDFTWIGLVANKFYRSQIGFLLKDKFDLVPALAFYLIFLVGLLVFVIKPAIDNQSVQQAAQMGALFGVVTYATYDLTNLATVKNWPLAVTFVDMAWGAVLSASVAAITVALSI